MALVAYSDSETSDAEPTAPSKSNIPSTKPAAKFQKVEARKIKVDLPTPNQKHKAQRQIGQQASKNQCLLPAPKRTAAQHAPAKGVSLKTSSEAAFSREPVASYGGGEQVDGESSGSVLVEGEKTQTQESGEVQTVGKATRFKPLSVQAGKKKKKAKPVVAAAASAGANGGGGHGGGGEKTDVEESTIRETPAPPPANPKTSLFSLAPAVQTDTEPQSATYEALISNSQPPDNDDLSSSETAQGANAHPISTNNLQSLTADLNLTPAQRRQIFGRNASKDANISITHFDTSAEYAANEVIRSSGETIQHKAVKAVAPGKHSLQQLVNNARSQQENLEDKWAEGRAKRGQRG